MRIAPDDQVAVAVRDIEGAATVLMDGELVRHTLRSTVATGHKFALMDMPAGTAIRKYGHVIGVLTRDVASGERVHVHNLASLRARCAGA